MTCRLMVVRIVMEVIRAKSGFFGSSYSGCAREECSEEPEGEEKLVANQRRRFFEFIYSTQASFFPLTQ